MKFIKTNAIDELLLVGRSAIIITDNPNIEIEYS